MPMVPYPGMMAGPFPPGVRGHAGGPANMPPGSNFAPPQKAENKDFQSLMPGQVCF